MYSLNLNMYFRNEIHYKNEWNIYAFAETLENLFHKY